jgi:hypothetical protein
MGECAPTIALEISIEIVDLGQDRVRQEGGTEPLLGPPKQVVTVGTPVPTAAPAAMERRKGAPSVFARARSC